MGVAGIAVAIAFLLDLAHPRAHWLTIKAPPAAVLGTDLPVRVRVLAIHAGEQLTVDLHGRAKGIRGQWKGVLTGATQTIRKGVEVYDFSLRVPHQTDLGSVSGVVYLSPNGKWIDRAEAAETESLPVAEAGLAHPWAPPTPIALKAFALEPPLPRTAIPSDVPRWVCAGLLLGTGVLIGLRADCGPTWFGGESLRILGGWRILAGCFWFAGCWEAFKLGDWVASVARFGAEQADLYRGREAVLVAATSLAIAALLGSLMGVWDARWPVRAKLLVGGLLVWAGIAAVEALSLHAIDRLNSVVGLGATPLLWARLAAASGGFWAGLSFARGAHEGPNGLSRKVFRRRKRN